jgi:hypothetical protein
VLIAAATPTRHIVARALLALSVALLAALAVLAAFYVGDVESMVAAVSAQPDVAAGGITSS